MTTKLRAASFQDGAVTTAKIAAAAITNAKIADGAVDSDAIGSSAIVANKLDIGQIGGRRNIVYNGAMNIAQRSTSLTGQGAYPGGYLTVDRWKFVTNNSAGRFTVTQEAITDLPGFLNCTKLDCTTADTSIGAGEYLMFSQYFEGQDVQQLKKGTSEAEKVTVSFYVKGNANATYTCELFDSNNSRQNGQEFSVTTSWNRVSLTYDGDTTGAFNDDNAVSLRLFIWLHAGSNYNGGTFTSNSWHTTNNQRVGDNQTSFYDSTDRTFFITGVQLEVGSQATPFEHRSFGEELFLCQRYFRDLCSGINGSVLSLVTHYASTNAVGTFVLSPEMRTTPTAIAVSSASHFTTYSAAAARVCSALTTDSFAPNIARMTATISSITAGYSGWIQPNTTSATMQITAEL